MRYGFFPVARTDDKARLGDQARLGDFALWLRRAFATLLGQLLLVCSSISAATKLILVTGLDYCTAAPHTAQSSSIFAAKDSYIPSSLGLTRQSTIPSLAGGCFGWRKGSFITRSYCVTQCAAIHNEKPMASAHQSAKVGDNSIPTTGDIASRNRQHDKGPALIAVDKVHTKETITAHWRDLQRQATCSCDQALACDVEIP